MTTDARVVLSALNEAVNAAVAEASGSRVSCQRAVPRVDGTLYFDFMSPEGALRLNWLDPGQGTGHHLAFSVGLEPQEPDRSRLLQAVVATFEDILDSEDYTLLRFTNRGVSRIRFDSEIVPRLLADRLIPEQTRWFSYVFRGHREQHPGRIRLRFENPRGPVGFEIGPAVPPIDTDRVIFTNNVVVAYLVEDSRDPALRSQVVHQVERFVGFLFNRAIPPGMRLDVESMSLAFGGDQGAPVSTSRWGNPRQWHQFFSDFEIERSSLCSFRFVDPITWVTHGEAECRWIEPELSPRAVWYVNPPWEQERPQGSPGSQSVFTTLVEQDVVMGGLEKLEGALETATSNEHARFVCLNNTCLPKIIGDDVASCVERFNRRGGSVPILSLNTDLESPDSSFHDLVRQAKEKMGPPAAAERRGLNLVGFPPCRGRRELISVLSQMDIAVNMCLLPDIGIDLLTDYLQGASAVVYPHHSWEKLSQKVLSDLDVPVRILPAPYGFTRSLEWCQAAAGLMDKAGQFEAWKNTHLDRFKQEWEYLCSQAAGFSLAFVVDQQSRERLEDPSRLYGFDILFVLCEMGFNVRLLTHAKDFSSREELNELLGGGDFQAVYSEVFFDKRLTRAGKAQFNLSMLEMGILGAMRSIRRLINLCRFPFYRRYAEYLERGKQ